MSRAIGKPSRQPNNVLAECRRALKLSHEKLAYLVRQKARERSIPIGTLDSITRHIKRIESGYVHNPSVIYRNLLCAVLDKTPADLFGVMAPDYQCAPPHTSRSSGEKRTFQLRNHKLIPAFIGADLAERAINNLAMKAAVASSTECYCCTLHHPREGVDSDLWVWPFGVALFHIVEDVEFPSLSSFAVWHRRVYDEQIGWVNQEVGALLGSTVTAQYAMPLNWIIRSIWTRSELDTALRILSTPRILLRGEVSTESSDLAHAELVERALFRDGFDRLAMTEFGVEGISAGVASWSGVVYFPIAPHRALSESELLTYELAVQATWSYCDWIRSQVETGNDPEVRPQHGWRLLRALRSIVTNPRPEEGPQFYPLRIAVLETSGVAEHLRQATEAALDFMRLSREYR